jgi:pantoate--beta-alanine ligase
MKVISDPKEFQALALAWRKGRRSVGFVPTMGALHEGHLQLVRRCRKENPITAVSIFVNPLQFGPKEDLSKYPRTLEEDLRLLKREKASFVFTPTEGSLYEDLFATKIKVEGPLVKGLCGAYRPGHFDGVATVVVKLLGVVQPDRMYLGQKDYQQAAVLKRVTTDLNLPVELRVCETVREPDGLAMSSRNLRLTPEGHRAALALYRGLKVGRGIFDLGETDSDKILRKVKDMVGDEKKVKLQYLEAVHPETLREVEIAMPGTVLALAAFVDEVRLIDNLIL